MQLKKAEREQITRSGRFEKRIGSTVYGVSVYFKDGCRETPEDKIFRIVSNSGLKNAPKSAIIEKLQTERLPGGSI
jgi:hypothetical protein